MHGDGRKKPGIRKEIFKIITRYYYFFWALSFGAGMYSGRALLHKGSMAVSNENLLIASLFALLAGSFLVYARILRRGFKKAYPLKMIFLVFVPVVMFSICGYLTSFSTNEEVNTTGEEKPVPVRLTGRVEGHPEIIYGNTCFDLAVYDSDNQSISRGTVISTVVKGNSGNICRDDLLEIAGEIHLDGNSPILKTDGSSIEYTTDNSLAGRIFKLRQRFYICISGAFSHYLESENAALANALILGDRRRISRYRYDAFKKSGTAHLIAISGMHISFLAAIIYVLLKKTLKGAAVMVMLVTILVFYNFLLGPGASVMRATVWVLAAAAASSWKRPIRPSYMLCLSFIIVPVLDPAFIDNAGFWLSFSAMTGIVLIYPVIRKLLEISGLSSAVIRNYITSTILVTFSIQLACGPLLLYYFGSLPLISPAANLFMLPLFYMLILILFSSAILCIIWPPAGGLLLKAAPYLFRSVYGVAGFFSGSRFPSISMENVQIPKIAIYYFTLFAFFSIIKIILARKKFVKSMAEQKILKKAYLYISRDERALSGKVEDIKKYISRKEAETDIKSFDTSSRESLEDFDDFVASPSLFSPRKVALLEHIEKAPAAFQKKAAKALAGDSGVDIVLIFTSSKEKIDKSLLDAVNEVGLVKKIRPPSAGDLFKWLDRKAASDGISFTEDARSLLAEYVNMDMGLMKSQYGKLSCYINSEKDKTIDADAVRALVSRVYSMKIFDLVDFLGQRDKSRSLEALEDILIEDKKLMGLITLIHRMFKSMLYIKTDESRGSVTSYLAENTNIPPYLVSKMVNKYIKFSRNYSVQEIAGIIDMLNDYDMEFRSGITDNSKLAKVMIARIAGMKAVN